MKADCQIFVLMMSVINEYFEFIDFRVEVDQRSKISFEYFCRCFEEFVTYDARQKRYR